MKNLFTIAAIALAMSACTNNKSTNQSHPTEEAAIKQTVIKAVKDSLTLDSFKKAEVAKKEQKEAAVAETKSHQSSSRENQAGSASSTTSQPAASSTTAAAPEAAPKKEGWSDAAKGSVIGGAAGAVGGALIDKKKGRGAIVGGVVGAGTGYLIGRGKDRKSGRVQKKD